MWGQIYNYNFSLSNIQSVLYRIKVMACRLSSKGCRILKNRVVREDQTMPFLQHSRTNPGNGNRNFGELQVRGQIRKRKVQDANY